MVSQGIMRLCEESDERFHDKKVLPFLPVNNPVILEGSVFTLCGLIVYNDQLLGHILYYVGRTSDSVLVRKLRLRCYNE